MINDKDFATQVQILMGLSNLKITMIKDKITPELKKKFAQEIEKTMATGKEHGFLLCVDKKENLYPSKSSVGENDKIEFLEIKSQCSFKIQGDFHTHAPISDMKTFIRDNIPEEDVSNETVHNITTKLYKKNGISITGPSHGDLINALNMKRNNKIIGTVCIGNDAQPNKVECWTAIDNITADDYNKANKDIENGKSIRDPPHEWIRPLFHKETIDIRRI